MLMILARLVRSESFWAVVKVRSPHTVPEVCYIITLGPPIKGDCGRRHSILHACKNHTSCEATACEQPVGRRHGRHVRPLRTRVRPEGRL